MAFSRIVLLTHPCGEKKKKKEIIGDISHYVALRV